MPAKAHPRDTTLIKLLQGLHSQGAYRTLCQSEVGVPALSAGRLMLSPVLAAFFLAGMALLNHPLEYSNMVTYHVLSR